MSFIDTEFGMAEVIMAKYRQHKNGKRRRKTVEKKVRWEMTSSAARMLRSVLPHFFDGSDVGDRQANAYKRALSSVKELSE
jgi:hypothetical protein